MKKLSNILKESVWSDIHKRSNGEQVRKEDELTKKDRKDLDKLIVSYANEFVYGKGYSIAFFKMDKGAGNLDDFCYYIETNNEIKDLNKDKILQYVKDYWADKVCEDVTGAIEQADLEYHQDMNESVWADIHKRSNGEQERKEDKFNMNTHMMNPVDLGSYAPVYFADIDLEVNGENEFIFDEIKSLSFPSGWRLPTSTEFESAVYEDIDIDETTHKNLTIIDNIPNSITFKGVEELYFDLNGHNSVYYWCDDSSNGTWPSVEVGWCPRNSADYVVIGGEHKGKGRIRLVKDK